MSCSEEGAAGHAEEEPPSSQAAAEGSRSESIPRSVGDERRIGALENDREFRAFADAAYAQLTGRAEGYSDVTQLLRDF